VQEDKPETEPQPDPWETEVGRRLLEERAMIERTLAAMTNAVRQHHEQRSLERAEWRRTAVELAVTLATRLVHDQILSGDYPVETILREMIGQVDGGPVKVHLHPQDLSLLRQRLQGRPLIEGMEGLGIEPDPELARGDCRVEVNDNIVLSQLENQLTEMRGRLLRSLGNAQV
jgi:flagellar biosynthesis/type III secretory pathway protein FliH